MDVTFKVRLVFAELPPNDAFPFDRRLYQQFSIVSLTITSAHFLASDKGFREAVFID